MELVTTSSYTVVDVCERFHADGARIFFDHLFSLGWEFWLWDDHGPWLRCDIGPFLWDDIGPWLSLPRTSPTLTNFFVVCNVSLIFFFNSCCWKLRCSDVPAAKTCGTLACNPIFHVVYLGDFLVCEADCVDSCVF